MQKYYLKGKNHSSGQRNLRALKSPVHSSLQPPYATAGEKKETYEVKRLKYSRARLPPNLPRPLLHH
jgi:hypothetical protein